MQLVRVHRVMFMVDVSTCGVSATGNTQTLATKRHGGFGGGGGLTFVGRCVRVGHQCCREGLVISS